ncbi:MAG: hypothetical protein M9928_15625 [Anaerolineae bacterium]|nr:hypothetical protein [Anaerolineae bacterium]MCO5194557.1 hypothetical protein [Anaerolineae bacterium]MCO5199630.1 hypothetical protein [Anaerolineae bacterium]MCO5206466.1 hypothetical protein [Anaerolineae bacterium]
MSFGYDISTDAGILRFALGDTAENIGPRPGARNFSDAEIAHLLNVANNDIDQATLAGLEILSNEWSAYAGSQKLGPEAQAFDQAKEYAKRASELRVQIGSRHNRNGRGGFAVTTQPARIAS